ncbi:hypothetical protein [Streptomyces sp. MW-W600-10]|uniref:hypothetical protein n=1 Tax=Streptomyces sp. MW-W600-10 TaxID=2829819 RepID=UPI001C451594|nr:hypothetical protein [Streptomyces sp. MW-W600-10]MBV7243589.1 hypothetical protein [Streptomyces sp. MW-W600-10]
MSDAFPPPPTEPEPQAPQASQQPAFTQPPSPWAPPAAPPQGQRRTGLIVTLSLIGGLVVTGATAALVYAFLQEASESFARAEDRVTSRYDTMGPEDEEGWEEFEELEDGEDFGEFGAPEDDGPPADKDATITKCTRDSLINWMSADIKVVNGSTSPASYVVFVSFVDRDGDVVTEGLAVTDDDVAPGATARIEAQGLGEVPAGTKCRIDRVEREAMTG